MFLVEIDKQVVKFTRKCEGPSMIKITLKKKKVGGQTLPDFKIYYKATITKRV